MAAILYPGAFKPPHRGHFEIVKRLLNGTLKGTEYDFQDYREKGAALLDGRGYKVGPFEKVVVFVGDAIRNGITVDEARKIWEIYAKYLPGLEINTDKPNPMFGAYVYGKEHPEESFYSITGMRSEEDLKDLRRVSMYKNVPNVEGLAVLSPEDIRDLRATDFRSVILSGNLDEITDFFPAELSRKEILKIINMLKSTIVADEASAALDEALGKVFQKEITTEGSSGTAIAPQSVERSEDRDKLLKLFYKIRDQIGGPDGNFTVIFNQNNIKIEMKDEAARQGFDYTPYMASMMSHMMDEGLKIHPIPEVTINHDLDESTNFFRKTAQYDPNKKEITLFTEGRHPKDVMRSFAHELIHHHQNLEGRLNEVSTEDTTKSKSLQKLEAEAYLKGNMMFRTWEDKIKRNPQQESE